MGVLPIEIDCLREVLVLAMDELNGPAVPVDDFRLAGPLVIAQAVLCVFEVFDEKQDFAFE